MFLSECVNKDAGLVVVEGGGFILCAPVSRPALISVVNELFSNNRL